MVAGTERRAARIDFAPEGEAEDPIHDELLEQLVDRRRLRFPEPLESAFRDDFARRWLRTNRSAFWVGIVLYLALAALDLYAAPESGGQILLIRVGFIAVYGLPVMLLTMRPWYLRWMQPVSAIGIFLGGFAVVVMELVLEPHEPAYGLYIFGVTLVISFAYAVPNCGWPGRRLPAGRSPPRRSPSRSMTRSTIRPRSPIRHDRGLHRGHQHRRHDRRVLHRAG